jgi:hypothetical protein
MSKTKIVKDQKYDYSDLREFDRLLKLTEIKTPNDYRRNIGRLELSKWLEKFDKATADEMFAKIKDWK